MQKKINHSRREVFDQSDADLYLYSWNYLFPFDYWWRKMYKVSFGSETHKDTSLVDMYLEFREYSLFRKKKPDSDKYVRGEGSIFKPTIGGYSQDEVDNLFDNINIG